MNASPRLTCARAKSGRRRLASRNAAAASVYLHCSKSAPPSSAWIEALPGWRRTASRRTASASAGRRWRRRQSPRPRRARTSSGARRGKALLEILVHLAGLRDGVVAAHRAPLGVRRDAARDEDESPRLDDVGEVADGLGHLWNPDLFATTQIAHLSLRAVGVDWRL